MTITSRKFAFIDVETSGLDSHKHEILELGCVVVQGDDRIGWKVMSEINVKVKPTRIQDAEAQALRVNGYNETDWMFAHTLEQAIQELSEKAKDAIMVAHNVSFDYGFIDRAFKVTNIPNTMNYHKFDTISIAFAKLNKNPDVKNWSLRALCDYFGIMNEKAHTALADARATFEVFKELMKL